MRREGVYSSSPSIWRRQRKAAEQAALAPQKRGPKPAADRDQVLQIEVAGFVWTGIGVG
jgi:hypothetical protein